MSFSFSPLSLNHSLINSERKNFGIDLHFFDTTKKKSKKGNLHFHLIKKLQLLYTQSRN